MTGSSVNGTDANLAALNEGLPAIQALTEAAILEQLIGVFLADIAETALASNRQG
jgi:hypothetical protein